LFPFFTPRIVVAWKTGVKDGSYPFIAPLENPQPPVVPLLHGVE
jgi:hypothetical protein